MHDQDGGKPPTSTFDCAFMSAAHRHDTRDIFAVASWTGTRIPNETLTECERTSHGASTHPLTRNLARYVILINGCARHILSYRTTIATYCQVRHTKVSIFSDLLCRILMTYSLIIKSWSGTLARMDIHCGCLKKTLLRHDREKSLPMRRALKQATTTSMLLIFS